MLGSEIRNLVVVKMDECTPYGPKDGGPTVLLTGGDELSEIKPLDYYIDKSLAEAANEVLWLIPVYIVGYKTADVTAVPDEEDNRIGTIKMPSDYLRLHTLRMQGWAKPVHIASPVDSPMSSAQDLFWTRGKKEKPVVIVKGITQENGKDVATLAYYSVDASNEHVIKELKYIPRFNEQNEYGKAVAELIALNCAKKIYEVYGNIEQVNTMTNEINAVLANINQ